MPNCKDCKLCRLNQLYVLDHDSKKSMDSRYNKVNNDDTNDINTTMTPISDADRTLRLINLWLWIPSFALLVAYGISAHQIVLPLGNIPMTCSAISTIIHLHPPSTNTARHFQTVKGGMSVFSDFVIAFFLMALLIPGWIITAGGWGDKMLGSYAAVPMLINFTIHSYFVLRSIGYSWPFSKKTCPHCNGDLNLKQRQKQKQRAMSQHSGDSTSSKESYHEVADREANVGILESEDYREPRASTDDENERLIVTVSGE